MPAADWTSADVVSAQVVRRWQAIDPLLPQPGAAPPPDCGARLVVAGPGGRSSAVGTCEHWAGAASSLDLCWGAARRFRLTPQIAGPDVANSLDRLLSLWRDHLAEEPGADGEDTAAVVSWPSRDIDGVKTLLRHGLVPLAVIAARPTRQRGPAAVDAERTAGWTDENAVRPGADAGRADATASRSPGDTGEAAATASRADGDTPAADAASSAGDAPPGLRIRRAGPADIDTVVRLGLEVIRFDAHFGSVVERPGSADALRRDAAGLLTGPGGWTWLAERDGNPVGMLAAERPEAAGWIATMVRPAPVAYLMLMVVLPGERGSGIGAALTARLHREVEATGVAVTLLHYEQLNPLSAPFWGQQGYRPLWTSWEAWPARAMR